MTDYIGFRQQRHERNERFLATLAVLSFIYVSFLGGQVYESIKPDPEKQWCMAANQKYEAMRLSIQNSHGMILPVKQKGNRK